MHLIRHYRDYTASLVWLFLSSFAAAMLESAALVTIVPLGQAVTSDTSRFVGSLGPIDVDLSTGDLALVAMSAVLASVVFQLGAAFIRARTVARYEREVREAIFHDFLAASWPRQLADRGGRLHELASNHVTKAAAGFSQLSQGIKSLLSLIVLVFTALVLQPAAAGAILVLGVVLTLGFRPLARRARRYGIQIAAASVEAAEELNEGASNVREIRLFAVPEAFQRRMHATLVRQEHFRVRSVMYSGSVPAVFQSAGLLVLIGVLVLADQVADIETAELGAVLLLLLRALAYGQQFQSAYQNANENIGFVEALSDARAEYRRDVERFGDLELHAPRTLAVERVSFSYPPGAELALDGIDLSFEVGEMVGIVGHSGSGKSTLAQLLLRLRDPTAGTVRLDGQPVRAYDAASWARSVAFVPQETHLLNGTARENIRFFRSWIPDDAVVGAAAAVGIDEAIRALPDGYETEIGPGMRDLSGGQIQRIGIARALAGSPSILVLDEPTSALDVYSESVVQDFLRLIRPSTLLVVIAHRLSTLDACDRLIVLAHGRIEADGPRDEVRASHPFFTRMSALTNAADI